MQISYSSSRTIQGYSSGDVFSFSIVETPFGGYTTSYRTVKDTIYEDRTYTGIANNCQLVVPFQKDGSIPSFTSLTPSICSVDSSGNVSRISDGYGTVEITTKQGSKRFTRYFTTSGSYVVSYFSDFVAGSLAKTLSTTANTLIQSLSPGLSTQATYTSNNYSVSSLSAVRNSSLFCSAYDMSGMSAASNHGSAFPCCLISKRHIISAKHVGPFSSVAFLGKDSVAYTANITDSYEVANYDNTIQDIVVSYLDRDIDITKVVPFSVLPSNFRTYFPTVSAQVPIISKGMTRGDYIRLQMGSLLNKGDIVTVGFPTATTNRTIVSSTQTGSFYETIIPGDSSGPLWLPINGKLVLLDCIYDTGGGDHYGGYSGAINSTMNYLASKYGDGFTYSLNTVDLSSYPTY